MPAKISRIAQLSRCDQKPPGNPQQRTSAEMNFSGTKKWATVRAMALVE